MEPVSLLVYYTKVARKCKIRSLRDENRALPSNFCI